jgi:hypothetical protein
MARPGQKAAAPSALVPWRSCGPLFLAAIPLNDSTHLYAMPKMQTALQFPVQLALQAFTADHSRHYAAVKSHQPEVLMRRAESLAGA